MQEKTLNPKPDLPTKGDLGQIDESANTIWVELWPHIYSGGPFSPCRSTLSPITTLNGDKHAYLIHEGSLLLAAAVSNFRGRVSLVSRGFVKFFLRFGQMGTCPVVSRMEIRSERP